MKQKLTVGNSIYQGGYGEGGPGLTVVGGRLVNNAPDGRTGIAKMADANREMKVQRKISMQTDAILRADDIKEMRKMMGGCCD